MWGEAPRAHEDIWSVFAGYVEGRVPRLPWCEVALLPETSVIQTQLATLNREGFLTINSQPQVNAARSDDPTFGWGGPGGYVYQKAYVECFCPPSHVCALMDACASGRRPGITYHAVDVNGRGFTNSKAGAGAAAAASGGVLPEDAPWSSVNAVTWGVFPEKEILQPTVMDPDAFRGAWRAEAFALWTRQWAVVYDDDSDSADLLHSIHDSYWLVNIVDNDFLGGDVFGVFEDALRGLKAQRQGAGLPVVQGPGQGQAQGQGAAGTGSGAASAGTSQDPATTYASLVARGAICSTPPLAGRTGSYTGLSSLGALAASPAARSA